MLTSTFCHLTGIGPRAEERLWSAGILNWALYEGMGRGVFSSRKHESVLAGLAESKTALTAENAWHFLDGLPTDRRARVYPHFRTATGYLDIETTGLGPCAEVTTIALYDGAKVRTYARGVNLEEFARDVAAYRLLVTYNGARFDLPILRRTFLGVDWPKAHLDLMPVLRSLGCKGGLKRCEAILGLKRQVPEEVDGAEAVRLWWQHKKGDPRALKRLLAYNSQDAVSLEWLLVKAYNRSMAGFPLECGQVLPRQPVIEWPM